MAHLSQKESSMTGINTAIKRAFKNSLRLDKDLKLSDLSEDTLFLCGLIIFRIISTQNGEIMAIGEINPGSGMCLSSVVNRCYCFTSIFSVNGDSGSIEGLKNIPLGSTVALVRDVISTGETLLKAIKQLEHQGFKVGIVVSIVDCQEGGRELLEANGYRFVSIFTKSDFHS